MLSIIISETKLLTWMKVKVDDLTGDYIKTDKPRWTDCTVR